MNIELRCRGHVSDREHHRRSTNSLDFSQAAESFPIYDSTAIIETLNELPNEIGSDSASAKEICFGPSVDLSIYAVEYRNDCDDFRLTWTPKSVQAASDLPDPESSNAGSNRLIFSVGDSILRNDVHEEQDSKVSTTKYSRNLYALGYSSLAHSSGNFSVFGTEASFALSGALPEGSTVGNSRPYESNNPNGLVASQLEDAALGTKDVSSSINVAVLKNSCFPNNFSSNNMDETVTLVSFERSAAPSLLLAYQAIAAHRRRDTIMNYLEIRIDENVLGRIGVTLRMLDDLLDVRLSTDATSLADIVRSEFLVHRDAMSISGRDVDRIVVSSVGEDLPENTKLENGFDRTPNDSSPRRTIYLDRKQNTETHPHLLSIEAGASSYCSRAVYI